MKYLIALLFALALAAPASATHRQRVVVQRQQVVVQRVVVPRQQVVVQQFAVPHVQQFRVQQFVAPQAFYAPQQFVAPVQQFNSGCNNGSLQFNAGGCQQLYR